MTGKAYNQELADIYDNRHFGGRSGQFIFQKDCQILLSLLPPPPARILDVPCGTGIYSALLKAEGYEVVSADASLPMLRIAASRQTDTMGMQGDLKCLPFENETFDGIITLRLFSHFSQGAIIAMMRELRRVIRPGGRAIFDTFRWTPRGWPLMRNFMEKSYIEVASDSQIEDMVRVAGLEVNTSRSTYLFSPIWQRKLPYPLLRALAILEDGLPDQKLLRVFWACTRSAQDLHRQ